MCARQGPFGPDGEPLKVYLAGPMTGLPDRNYPAFHSKAAELRAMGFNVVNPAENSLPPNAPWEYFMRLGIAELTACDTIALLPGWQRSNGAMVELSLAILLKLDIVIL